jgi:hypothetical protein
MVHYSTRIIHPRSANVGSSGPPAIRKIYVDTSASERLALDWTHVHVVRLPELMLPVYSLTASFKESDAFSESYGI